jgi:hypothetical protein
MLEHSPTIKKALKRNCFSIEKHAVTYSKTLKTNV